MSSNSLNSDSLSVNATAICVGRMKTSHIIRMRSLMTHIRTTLLTHAVLMGRVTTHATMKTIAATYAISAGLDNGTSQTRGATTKTSGISACGILTTHMHGLNTTSAKTSLTSFRAARRGWIIQGIGATFSSNANGMKGDVQIHQTLTTVLKKYTSVLLDEDNKDLYDFVPPWAGAQ